MSPYVALLSLLVVAQVAIGLWIGRRVRSASDFFVAGRGLPPFLVFATFLAANIGAGSTVNAASLGYRYGLSAWWWNGAAGIGSIVLGLWLGPRIWTIARERGFLTLGDFLETRYSPGVRTAASALIWVSTLFILAAQLIGASWILNVVAGLPRAAGALVGGAVMVTYFVAGGLLGSAWVNLVQLAVLLAGFALAVPLALGTVEGWQGLGAAPGLDPSFLQIMGTDDTWLTWLILLAPAFVVSPGLVQKAYGARSPGAVRIGVTANGLALLTFAFAPALLGMVARAHHPSLASPDLALPTVMVEQLPTLVGALALSAVFAAEVSSADAILFMLATSFGQDLYRRLLKPAASERQVLAAARWAAVAGGAGGILLALVVPTIVEALRVFYGVLTVALFVPVAVGVASQGPRAGSAVAGMTAGLAAMLLAYALGGSGGVWGLAPSTCGLAASALGFAAATLAPRR
ncbi:MAG TPA: sodium:solute symporter family protein [Methylomirabilota bacterium]